MNSDRAAEVRKERRRLRSERAFQDYWNMGLRRSKEELWRRYVDANRRGEEVPTTHKGDISAWSKEFNWEERISQRTMQQIERESEALESQKQQFLDDLALLLDSAHVALSELVTNSTGKVPPQVQLKAIELLTDRLNVAVPRSAAKPVQPGKKVDLATATEEEIQRYLAERARGGHGVS